MILTSVSECERLLHDAEALAGVLLLLGIALPASFRETVEHSWKQTLLCQFHDVLPGSSIPIVHRETKEIHEAVVASLSKLIRDMMTLVVLAEGDAAPDKALVFNPVDAGRTGPFLIMAHDSCTVPPRVVSLQFTLRLVQFHFMAVD